MRGNEVNVCVCAHAHVCVCCVPLIKECTETKRSKIRLDCSKCKSDKQGKQTIDSERKQVHAEEKYCHEELKYQIMLIKK